MKLISQQYVSPPMVEFRYVYTIEMDYSERLQLIQVLRQGLTTEVGSSYRQGAEEMLKVLGVQP